MLLHLAGVNDYAVLHIVGSKRRSVAQVLRTIQYLFEYGGRFCRLQADLNESDYFSFADDSEVDADKRVSQME
jgi:hypothetical protein